jgi:hypothetical protein
MNLLPPKWQTCRKIETKVSLFRETQLKPNILFNGQKFLFVDLGNVHDVLMPLFTGEIFKPITKIFAYADFTTNCYGIKDPVLKHERLTIFKSPNLQRSTADLQFVWDLSRLAKTCSNCTFFIVSKDTLWHGIDTVVSTDNWSSSPSTNKAVVLTCWEELRTEIE